MSYYNIKRKGYRQIAQKLTDRGSRLYTSRSCYCSIPQQKADELRKAPQP